MRQFFALAVFSLSVVGCASVEEYRKSGVPEGYSGEAATVIDTFERKSEGEANFYYLASVNGTPVENAVQRMSRATEEVASGQRLWLVSASRQVPAGELTLELVAWEASLAPMFSTVDGAPVASQEVTFVAQPDEKYLVRGNQSWQGAAAWVETVDGEVVSGVAGDIALYEQYKKVDTGYPEHYATFIKLFGGETGESVKSRLGQPNKVQKNARMQREEGVERTVFSYEGLGRLKFNSYNDEKYLDHKVPSDDIRDPEVLFSLALHAPYASKRLLIKTIHHRGHKPIGTELLDRMATYVWYHRHVRDGEMKDALAWICKVLGKRGDGRYNDFLRKLDASVNSRKLKRHASRSIQEFVGEGVTQFSVE